jgi:hypothetical protein
LGELLQMRGLGIGNRGRDGKGSLRYITNAGERLADERPNYFYRGRRILWERIKRFLLRDWAAVYDELRPFAVCDLSKPTSKGAAQPGNGLNGGPPHDKSEGCCNGCEATARLSIKKDEMKAPHSSAVTHLVFVRPTRFFR